MSIAGIDETTPLDTAFVGDGAGQIRALKDAIKTCFPGVDGIITKPADYNATGSTTPTAADFSQLFTDVEALASPTTSNSTIIPIGTIVAWWGDPTDTAAINALGWYLADGGTYNTFVTPNLTDSFLKGWDGTTDNRAAQVAAGTLSAVATSSAFVVGTALGAETAKTTSQTASPVLTLANIPQHRHSMFINNDDTRTATAPGAGQSGANHAYVAAESGASDAEYRLAGAAIDPDLFETGDYGNVSPDGVSIDVSLDAAGFAHEHKVDLSGGLEPQHAVVAFIVYCGVV